jgi:hypothetical protein
MENLIDPSNVEKSVFEINNPEEFKRKMEKTFPENPIEYDLPRPHLNKSEFSDFMRFINRNTVMLEVGGGASSAYWTRYVKSLVVVESSKFISEKIKETVSKLSKGSDLTVHWTPPNFQQVSLSVGARPGQFDDMIKFISRLENDTFDFAFIDGRDRLRSAEACIHSVKIGGFIAIHDFWQRKKYHSILNNPSLAVAKISKNKTYSMEMYKETGNSLVILQRIS